MGSGAVQTSSEMVCAHSGCVAPPMHESSTNARRTCPVKGLTKKWCGCERGFPANIMGGSMVFYIFVRSGAWFTPFSCLGMPEYHGDWLYGLHKIEYNTRLSNDQG